MTGYRELFQGRFDDIRFDEPLAFHTSFKIGGPAEVFATPRDATEAAHVLKMARQAGVPIFILGAGANILVSDEGIHGLVVSLEKLNRCAIDGPVVRAQAGCPISLVAEQSAAAGLEGLERFYSMPGSVGGAVYMNARCYEGEIADTLHAVTVITPDFEMISKTVQKKLFSYKRSPYMNSGEVILEAEFRLRKADPRALRDTMRALKRDRESKGHFSAPSAGSVFKNDRAFGAPSGQLIDALGLKGYAIGGAQISPVHANIIINTGNATANDVKKLISLVEKRVFEHYGFALEKELICIGG